MTLIAHIILLIAALFALCIMMRWDIMILQRNDYNNSQYNKWLKKSSEFTSIKRLVILAVLLASCTTMARYSWIVVVILAVTLLVLGIVMLRSKQEHSLENNKRVWRLFLTAFVLALIIIEVAAFIGSRQDETIAAQSASLTSVLLLGASPMLVMLVNWLLGPIERRIGKTKNDKNAS